MTAAASFGGDSSSPQPHIRKFAAVLIRRKARELSRHAGFSPSDREDIEQELRLILLRRLGKFDPAIAHYNAFVTTVIERYCATILEHRSAESRTHRRCGGSLNQMVDDGDGNQIELAAKIQDGHQTNRTGGRFRSNEDLVDLATDVTDVVAGLPPQLQDVFQRLKRGSISEVARELGMSRTTLCDLITRLRARFEQSGMREYL